MGTLTSSGFTPLALGSLVLAAVAGCTLIVVVIGVLIDRSAAEHERTTKDR
ncbi:MAG: hypothetical protein AB7I50_08685 [Vicinamibacterales bacterium]